MSQSTAAPEAPAVVSAKSLKTSIKVEPLSCAIGAELSNVNLGVASRDPALVAEIRALLLQYRVLFFRDQDITRAEHVAFARHFGDLEDHPVLGSDPENPGSCASTRHPIRRSTATRTRGTPMQHGAICRRSAACSAASSVRRSEATRCGPTWCSPTSGCPNAKTQIAGLRARHSIEASFGAAMPTEKRHALKEQFPDAEHPVVRTHPETGEKVLFVNAYTTHFTNFHTADTCATGRTMRRARPTTAIPDQPGVHPRIPGALPLEAEQHGHVGQPLDAALRGDGLPALPSQDGARRNHRRQAVLTARPSGFAHVSPPDGSARRFAVVGRHGAQGRRFAARSARRSRSSMPGTTTERRATARSSA